MSGGTSDFSPQEQWDWYEAWFSRTVSHAKIEQFERELVERLRTPGAPNPNVLAAMLEDLRVRFAKRKGTYVPPRAGFLVSDPYPD